MFEGVCGAVYNTVAAASGLFSDDDDDEELQIL